MRPTSPIHGILPSLVTPFGADESLDLAAMTRVARFAVDGGAHGALCFGLAGEVWKLSVAERGTLLEVILDAVDGAIPVLPGVGCESVRESVAWAAKAEALGAAAVVLPPPTGSRYGADGLVDYLCAVAGAVDVPVMIQNAAAYLGVALTPDIVLRVRDRCPNATLLKLEAGPDELAGWIAAVGDGLAVFGGDAGLYLVDAVGVGAAGIAPGVEVVDLLVAAWDAIGLEGPVAATARLAPLLPLLALEMVSIETYCAAAKHVLGRRGVLSSPARRLPATALAPATLGLIDAHLERLGLLG
jgi:4-hydroxy-tetrahydrodipicolinate synthase